jgi:hypothetical protein
VGVATVPKEPNDAGDNIAAVFFLAGVMIVCAQQKPDFSAEGR